MNKFLVLLLVLVSTQSFAQNGGIEIDILSKSQIKKIIGDYPAKGSSAEENDFRVLLDYQDTRSEQDCEAAQGDRNISVENLFGPETGILTKGEVRLMNLHLASAYVTAGINIHTAKKIYKRPRPYIYNPEVKPCIDLEKSYAYPSGHTFLARLFARLISKVYPERADKILARSTQFAESRVIGGVHHPSDIKAANALADYLAEAMGN
jgi:acid phosphatase (class A)